MKRKKKVCLFNKHHSKATAVCLTSTYSHSSCSEFFQPSTPNHMNMQEESTDTQVGVLSVLIWAWLALNLLNHYFSSGLPSLLRREHKEKSEAQGTHWKGTSYSCFLGLQHTEQPKAQYRWLVANSSDSWSWHEGFKAQLLGIIHSSVFNSYT